MESNQKAYDPKESVERLDEIIATANNQYEELKYIPARSRLTYTNGFYVECSCIFLDLRNSTALAQQWNRPTLAKIYRSYISEMVAILNANAKCAEVYMEGDGVWGMFDTPLRSDIDATFDTAAAAHSVLKILNWRLGKWGAKPLSMGMGISYGRALMIQAGYKGSGLSDAVWMGELVAEASRLCSYGNRSVQDHPVMVSQAFYGNLNDSNKALLAWNANRQCYHGNVISVVLEKWYNDNCK